MEEKILKIKFNWRSFSRIPMIYYLMTEKIKDISPTLKFDRNPKEMLCAIMLSAGTYDTRVNKIFHKTLKILGGIRGIAENSIEKIETYLRPLGQFRKKAKNLKEICSKLKDLQKIPSEMNFLLNFSGVGEKTAMVFRSQIYGIPEFAVDTHVKRLSRRWNLTKEKDSSKISRDVRRYIPKKYWSEFHLKMIRWGRKYCKASSKICSCKICSSSILKLI